MKLISEEATDVEFLTEVNKNGKGKVYYIEGIFMQSQIKNRNGRVYPKEVMIKEVNRYRKDFIDNKRAFGELGHPEGPTINLDRLSHMLRHCTQIYIDLHWLSYIFRDTRRCTQFFHVFK